MANKAKVAQPTLFIEDEISTKKENRVAASKRTVVELNVNSMGLNAVFSGRSLKYTSFQDYIKHR